MSQCLCRKETQNPLASATPAAAVSLTISLQGKSLDNHPLTSELYILTDNQKESVVMRPFSKAGNTDTVTPLIHSKREIHILTPLMGDSPIVVFRGCPAANPLNHRQHCAFPSADALIKQNAPLGFDNNSALVSN